MNRLGYVLTQCALGSTSGLIVGLMSHNLAAALIAGSLSAALLMLLIPYERQ